MNEAFERGGEGAAALAEAVVDAADHPNEFEHTYPIDAPINAKIEAIAKRVYGAESVLFLQTAKDKIRQYAATGLERLPICMAKTHLSLSHDPALANAPTGFEVTVRDLRAYTGRAGSSPSAARCRRCPGSAPHPPRSTSTSTRTGARLASSSFLDVRVKEFLDAVPARTPAPGGGSVAAITLSLAAGLTAMAARFAADDWERRAEIVGRAEALRARAEPLADADAEATARSWLPGRARPSSGSSQSRSSWPRSPPSWPSWPRLWRTTAIRTSAATRPQRRPGRSGGVDRRPPRRDQRAGGRRAIPAARRNAARAAARPAERPLRTCPRDCPWDMSRNAEIPAAVRSKALRRGDLGRSRRRLDGDDVEGLGALLTLACLELHLRALGEDLKPSPPMPLWWTKRSLPPSSGAMKP